MIFQLTGINETENSAEQITGIEITDNRLVTANRSRVTKILARAGGAVDPGKFFSPHLA